MNQSPALPSRTFAVLVALSFTAAALTAGSAPAQDGDGAASFLPPDSTSWSGGTGYPPPPDPDPRLTNNPPTCQVEVTPSGSIELDGDLSVVTFSATGSDDGDGGTQGIYYDWSRISGPNDGHIEEPDRFSTAVLFSSPGVYQYRLTIDDGQGENSTSECVVEITVQLAQAPTFVRGDCNADGLWNDMSDAISLLQLLFLGEDAPACRAACDVNADGELALTDGIRMLAYNFFDGPAPEAPFPACGTSEAEGDKVLGCESADVCFPDTSGKARNLYCCRPWFDR